ncbi:SGNH/GDSL hydrolase family protein [Limibacter armeniacum]|uniref:SGNH/GDSL hydrolase family protein n=1 Tax=Limibacter armeniacum TaxID=466084 RepID=UPI002FE5F333
MKNIYKAFLGASVLLAVSACEPEVDEIEIKNGTNPVTQKEIDYSTFAAIGNSLTAGYGDGAWSKSGLENSYPSLIAAQLKDAGLGAEVFNQATEGLTESGVNADGSGKIVIKGFVGASPVFLPIGDGKKMSDLASIGGEGKFFHNMGVPGMKAVHLQIPGFSQANPLFYFASSQTTSVAADLAKVNPSFVTVWIGNNDLLGYATAGADVTKDQMSEPTDIETAIKGTLDGLTNLTGGAIANIPDVMAMPLFNIAPSAGLAQHESQVFDATAADNANSALKTKIKANIKVEGAQQIALAKTQAEAGVTAVLLATIKGAGLPVEELSMTDNVILGAVTQVVNELKAATIAAVEAEAGGPTIDQVFDSGSNGKLTVAKTVVIVMTVSELMEQNSSLTQEQATALAKEMMASETDEYELQAAAQELVNGWGALGVNTWSNINTWIQYTIASEATDAYQEFITTVLIGGGATAEEAEQYLATVDILNGEETDWAVEVEKFLAKTLWRNVIIQAVKGAAMQVGIDATSAEAVGNQALATLEKETPYFVPAEILESNFEEAMAEFQFSLYQQMDNFPVFTVGNNPFLIEDETVQPLGIRFATEEDRIPLTTFLTIQTLQATDPAKATELASLLTDEYVVTKAEIKEINEMREAYNEVIKNIADEYGLALVDAEGIFANKIIPGFTESGVAYSADFVTGNFFSLDGVHMTQRGYAIVANEFIDAINKKYKASIPKVSNLNDYPTVTLDHLESAQQ